MDDDERSLRRASQAINDGIVNAFNRSQFEDLYNFVTDDCVLIAPHFPPLVGVRAIIDTSKKFKKISPRTKHITTLRVNRLSPNFAIGTGTNAYERNDGSVFGHGRHLSMMKKVDGKWLGYKFMHIEEPDKLHTELQDWCDSMCHIVETNPKAAGTEMSTEDAILYPPVGDPVVGQKAVGEHNLMMHDPDVKFHAEVLKSMYLSKDIAAIHLKLDKSSVTTGKRGTFGSGLMIMKKVDGKWRQHRGIYALEVSESSTLLMEIQAMGNKLCQAFLEGRLETIVEDMSTEDSIVLAPGTDKQVKGRKALTEYNRALREEWRHFEVKPLKAEYLTANKDIAIVHSEGTFYKKSTPMKAEKATAILLMKKVDGEWRQHRCIWAPDIGLDPQAELDRMAELYERMYNSRPYKTVDRFFTEDVVGTSANCETVRGRAEFRAWMKKFENKFGELGKIETRTFKSEFVAPDTAIGMLDFEMTSTKNGGILESGRHVGVLKKVEGDWKIHKTFTVSFLDRQLLAEVQSVLDKLQGVMGADTAATSNTDEIFTINARIFPNHAPKPIAGRDAIRAFFHNPHKIDDAAFVISKLTRPSGDVTIVNGSWRHRGDDSAKFMSSLKKVGGNWLIDKLAWNSNVDRNLIAELQAVFVEFEKNFKSNTMALYDFFHKNFSLYPMDLPEVVGQQACVDFIASMPYNIADMKVVNAEWLTDRHVLCDQTFNFIDDDGNLIDKYKCIFLLEKTKEGKWVEIQVQFNTCIDPVSRAGISLLHDKLEVYANNSADKVTDDQISSLVTDDFSMTPFRSNRIRGKREFVNFIRDRQVRRGALKMKMEFKGIEMLSDTLATTTAITSYVDQDGHIAFRARLLTLVEKVDGRWLMKTVTTNELDPPLRKEMQALLEKMGDVWFKCPQEFGKFYTEDAVKLTSGASKVQRGRKEISEAAVRSRARLSADGSTSVCVDDVTRVSPTSVIMRGTNTITSASGQRSYNFINVLKRDVEGRWLIQKTSINAAFPKTGSAGGVGTLHGLKEQLKQMFPEPYNVDHAIEALIHHCTEDCRVNIPSLGPKGRDESLAIMESTRPLKWVARRKYTEFRLEAENFAVVTGTYTATSLSPDGDENGNFVENWRFVDGRWACCLATSIATKDPLVAEVEAVLAKYSALFVTAPEQVPTMCTENITVFTAAGHMFKGKKAVGELQLMARDWTKEQHIGFDITHAEAAGDDCILARGSFFWKLDGTIDDYGNILLTFKKEDNVLKVHHVYPTSSIDKNLWAELKITMDALTTDLNEDPLKTGDYFTKDCRIYAAGQPVRYGKDGAALANFDQGEKGLTTLKEYHLTFAERLSENVAMARANYKLVNKITGVDISGKTQLIMKKVDGFWRYHGAAW